MRLQWEIAMELLDLLASCSSPPRVHDEGVEASALDDYNNARGARGARR